MDFRKPFGRGFDLEKVRLRSEIRLMSDYDQNTLEVGMFGI